MRSLSLALCVSLGLLFAGVSTARAIKLGYVDLQRALKEVEDGKKAFKKLRSRYKKYQRMIRKKEKEVKKLQEKLKKQAVLLTDTAKKEKAREFQRKVLEFQSLYMEKQRELQKREKKAMGPIIARLVKVVRKMGAGGDYTMILERSDARVLFAQPSLDLTNEVIRRYNSRK